MGQTNSTGTKKITKDERQIIEQKKNQMVKNRLGEIDEFQKNISNSISNNTLTTRDGIDILLMSEKVKSQVNRGGSTLTKADLIAIILALTKNTDVSQYNTLNVNDLNTIIRSIIYDPKHISIKNEYEDSLVIRGKSQYFLIK